MSAEQLLHNAKLDEALSELQQQVRSDPSDTKSRVFLFQLLAVLGQWDRAMTQLNVAGDMDAETLAMVQTYREALPCEVLRSEIFAGQRSALMFGDPEPWMALIMEALRLTAADKHNEAQELRDRAFEEAPATAGTLDGEAFAWLADADIRLGPFLEAIVNGRYYWIPFHRIREIRIEEPADLRDLVWLPAYFTWANGGDTVGLIPTRYPGSENNADDLIRMGRKTEWLEPAAGVYFGQGQRLLATDAGDYPLMDVRRITLETGTEAEAAGDGETPATETPGG